MAVLASNGATWAEGALVSQQSSAIDSSLLCQAIVQAVGIPQTDAMESLKHADSDISAAFQNELARMQLNRHRLREMVLEYAGYR